jgi:hypothetical protein
MNGSQSLFRYLLRDLGRKIVSPLGMQAGGQRYLVPTACEAISKSGCALLELQLPATSKKRRCKWRVKLRKGTHSSGLAMLELIDAMLLAPGWRAVVA